MPPAAGGFAPRPPQPVTDGGFVPTPPNLFNSPQLQFFGYMPDQKHAEQSLREVKNRNHHHLNLRLYTICAYKFYHPPDKFSGFATARMAVRYGT